MSDEENNPEVKVGLSYEGRSDKEPLEIIVKRLLLEYGIKPKEDIFSRKSATGIIGNTRKHARLFYTLESIQLGFFITDSDKEKFQKRREKILKELKKENPSYLLNSVVGVIEPHLEKWLITDKNALRSVLKLGSKKITGKGLTPKEQLAHLYSKMDIPRLTLFQVEIKLAESVDFWLLNKNCGDFKAFYEDLAAKAKRICSIEVASMS